MMSRCDSLVLKKLTEQVERLYDFKNFYFDNHLVESAKNYYSDLRKELEKTVDILQAREAEALSENKAYYYYLLGKTYNVENEYNPKATEYLSKALKINDSLVDAWNNQGDALFKQGNYAEAKHCFINALAKGANKESYRYLSVVSRKLRAGTESEQHENVKQGLKYAQEALKLDPDDGMSWYILGNAYIASFFSIKQSSETLTLAMDAYNRAEDNKLSKNNPDLFYNKAVALRFQENYENALKYFDKAMTYDPAWTSIEEIKRKILKYLSSVQESIASRGRIKNKKLQILISGIDVKKHIGHFNQLSSDDKCPKLLNVQFEDLKTGINDRNIVVGVVVCSVQNEDQLPFTFCLVDSSNMCIAVTVYNLASGGGVIIGDYVAIAVPFLRHINFSYDDKNYNFKNIRVCNPMTMVVNGKPVPRHSLSSMQVSTFSETDKTN